VAVRRYGLISEVDARQIEPGTTVELEAGGHVTPLARDTLRARRVTVVRAGTVDADLPPDLGPVTPALRVAIGSDHTGVALKSVLVGHLRKAGRQVTDCGTTGPEPVDYPDVADAVARTVTRGEADAGIVIDGSGIGSAMAANKVRGARAAMCQTATLARYAREHNGTNVLALGSTLVDAAEAKEIVDVWLSTPTREARYLRRLLKVRRLEETF
jgi:RpiB/LacA/LacB family sugar-phosphate isomerase